jgi:MFS family permease
MPAVAASTRSRSARVAITAVFFVNGLVFTSVYARLPAIQAHLELGPGALGLALLGAPIGLLLAQPLVGAVIAARGSRPVLAMAPLLLLTAVLPALAVGATSLLLAVLMVGAGNGALDIAMNAQGLAVEQAARRQLFASLHAAFSFGALAGAALAAGAAIAGLPIAGHLLLAATAGTLVARAAVRHLPASPAHPAAPRLARPSRSLALLGAIAFCALLAEGAMFDWSGVYLARELHTSDGVAALGLAAFSVTMGAGRLAADPLAGRLGGPRTARAGAILAAGGLGTSLAAASPGLAAAGLAVMGLGLSALFPLTLQATSKQAAPPPALAAVSTLGYAGFLTGPPTIGLLADATSLRGALLLVCGLCLIAALLTRRMAGPPAPPPGTAP